MTDRNSHNIDIYINHSIDMSIIIQEHFDAFGVVKGQEARWKTVASRA